MASQWFLKTKLDVETGPIPFQELVDLVRLGEVVETDLVRPDWNAEWQRADRVVGLFYMARSGLTAVEAEAPPAVDVPEDAAALEVPLEVPVEHPGWMRRLLHLIRTPGTPATRTGATAVVGSLLGQSSSVGTDSPETTIELATPAEPELAVEPALVGATSAEWSSAMDAALAHTDTRTPGTNAVRKAGLLRRLFGWVENRRVRIAFRVVVAIGCAIAVAREVDRHSIQKTVLNERINFLYQQQVTRGYRGPPRDWQSRKRPRDIREPAVPKRYFPYVGECEMFAYSALLIGLTAATGIAAYLTEWFFEGYLTWKFYDQAGKFA